MSRASATSVRAGAVPGAWEQRMGIPAVLVGSVTARSGGAHGVSSVPCAGDGSARLPAGSADEHDALLELTENGADPAAVETAAPEHKLRTVRACSAGTGGKDVA